MVSYENKNEISEDINLSIVDYGITPPIVVFMGFAALKDVIGPNFTVMHNFIQF